MLCCKNMEQGPSDRAGPQIAVFSDDASACRSLRGAQKCAMAAVALPGAEGLNVCRHIRELRPDISIVWFSNQAAFEPESRRIPVDCFRVPIPEGGALIPAIFDIWRKSEQAGRHQKKSFAQV